MLSAHLMPHVVTGACAKMQAPKRLALRAACHLQGHWCTDIGSAVQSLHTTVLPIGASNELFPLEVQIRTADMHHLAEFGIAGANCAAPRSNGLPIRGGLAGAHLCIVCTGGGQNEACRHLLPLAPAAEHATRSLCSIAL